MIRFFTHTYFCKLEIFFLPHSEYLGAQFFKLIMAMPKMDMTRLSHTGLNWYFQPWYLQKSHEKGFNVYSLTQNSEKEREVN